MHLTFAGSAGAFTTGANYQSNMVVQTAPGGPCLLLDCGSDARRSLAALGLGAGDIDAVFVSHLHSDHVGGLEWLALTRKYDGGAGRPRLFVPAELRAPLWDHVLKGGLGATTEGPAALTDFFQVTELAPDGHFTWRGQRFDLVPTRHVVAGGEVLMWAYGLLFESCGLTGYITSDTVFDPERLQPFYDRADVIFHDCETGPASGVHPSYGELLSLAPALRAKLWLYHYQHQNADDARAAADGFRGYVRPGQCFAFDRPASLAGRAAAA